MDMFPLSRLDCLVSGASDHAHILLTTSFVGRRRTPHRSRVENEWLAKAEFDRVVKGS